MAELKAFKMQHRMFPDDAFSCGHAPPVSRLLASTLYLSLMLRQLQLSFFGALQPVPEPGCSGVTILEASKKARRTSRTGQKTVLHSLPMLYSFEI
jgi:hypothetical protein